MNIRIKFNYMRWFGSSYFNSSGENMTNVKTLSLLSFRLAITTKRIVPS